MNPRMRSQKVDPSFPDHLTYEPVCSVTGTYLQGHIKATYAMLREVFGEPDRLDDSKVRVEWAFRFCDQNGRDVIAAIYDWKRYDEPLEEVTEWNIGGYKPEAVDVVEIAIDEYDQRYTPPEDTREILVWPDTPEKRYADSVGLPLRWPG